MERYDYLRAEYYKENGKWPYTPRPLTNYEKKVMDGCELYGQSDRKQTYADIPLASLYQIADAIKGVSDDALKALLFMRNELLPLKGKGKDFPREKVESILKAIYTIYDRFIKRFGNKKDVISVMPGESESILSYLDGSKYYNENKSGLVNRFLKCRKDGLKNFYLDPDDIKLLCITVFKSIPQNIRDEIEKRKTYLSNKKSRDYSDFMDMRKKMMALYEAGKFQQGDELLKYYTGSGYEALNGIARHSFKVQLPSDLGGKDAAVSSIVGLDGDTKIIDEDFFMNTVLELDALRKRLESSKGADPDVKCLYRGMVLYKLFERIPRLELPKEWQNKRFFEEDLQDTVAKYLTDKIMVDPASLSTSLSVDTAREVAKEKEKGATGVVLVIDVSKYHKGQKMMDYSDYPDEQEILLPPGVKLKIKSVSFKKEGSDGYFEANCVPV